jgi:hypothetical protein
LPPDASLSTGLVDDKVQPVKAPLKSIQPQESGNCGKSTSESCPTTEQDTDDDCPF